jgi:DNA invertase Pin-like site-specific DNA recombinase
MVYGYARVSTNGQDLYGTSLEDQIDVLRKNGAVDIYADAYTGSSMKRPNFDKLLSVIRDGDTLIVTKMDRLGRTSEGIIALIKGFLKRDITVRVLNMGTIENTPVGRMIVTFLAGFAEFERDLIVERTKAGKEYKKLHDPDYRDGRKPMLYDANLFESLCEKVDSGEITAKDAWTTLGVGKTKWYEIVKERKTAS